MAEFGFTEAQEMLRRQVRAFSQKELRPGARERAKKESLDMSLVRRLGDLGLLGLNLPAEYGGTPADWVSVGTAIEEIARGDFALSVVPHQTIGVSLAILRGGKEVQQEWLPSLIRGEGVVALCVTEPGCGSDAAAMQTTATRTGDGYILRGEKTSVTFGMSAQVAVVFAKTDRAARTRGVTAFLVPLSLPGITRRGFKDTGCKPLTRASIFFDDVLVPARYRLGEEGQGFYTVMSQFDFIRICVALEALGAAQSSWEEAVEYAKNRRAFGQPIAKFEGVSFKIAEDITLLEAARLLCYKALWLMDQGKRNTLETAMCKWFAPKVAREVIHNALLIHGQVGYSEDLPIEQRLRDVIGWEIGDGTAEIMKVIISREIMGREYLPYQR
ncbi:MAG: acyl-CoA dehydrogenase family protein [Chloroflexi bacterium]|nr:acyl-CoA dehydrogenase family protein [Chloroflexota bacterium]